MDPEFNNRPDPEEKDEFFDPVPEERPEEKESLPSPRPTKQQKLTRSVLSVFLALLLLAAGFLIGWYVRYYSIDEDLRSFLWALDITERYYYPEGFSREQVLQDAGEGATGAALLEALNNNLDPYSTYYSPSEYEAYVSAGAGQNYDFGISFLVGDTSGTIALVSYNSPAFLAGIKKGMRIFAYGPNDADLTPFTTYEKFSQDISSYGLTVYLQAGYDEEECEGQMPYEVTAGVYQRTYCVYADSETAYYFLGDDGLTMSECADEAIASLDSDTCYIRIDEFGGNCANEFEACLEVMKERGREDVILDLRTNGGGYLDDLQQISSHLMRDASGSRPVVQIARYKGGREEYYYAYGNDFSEYFTSESDFYVLADENTASASECLIGVLIDYGTLPYDHIYLRETEDGSCSTYGKGIMQTSFVAANGAAMKLTVAGIFWPVSDTTIHGVGVTPEDGAVAVSAPLIWGEQDVMLEALIEDIAGDSIPSAAV